MWKSLSQAAKHQSGNGTITDFAAKKCTIRKP